jgi:hypothetical protein
MTSAPLRSPGTGPRPSNPTFGKLPSNTCALAGCVAQAGVTAIPYSEDAMLALAFGRQFMRSSDAAGGCTGADHGRAPWGGAQRAARNIRRRLIPRRCEFVHVAHLTRAELCDAEPIRRASLPDETAGPGMPSRCFAECRFVTRVLRLVPAREDRSGFRRMSQRSMTGQSSRTRSEQLDWHDISL